MRAFALLVAVLLLVPSAFAQDQAKPNSLTPKELADGWLLLFDGETPFGWSLQSALGKPGFEAKDAGLRLSTVKGQTMSVANTTPWNDFELECDFRCTSVGDARLIFAGLPKSFSLTFFATQPPEEWIHLRAVLTQAASGECKLASTYRTADGKDESFVRNGKADPAPCTLKLEIDGDTRLELRNVKLRPTGAKSIFNGKDLAGWKVFPGDKYKSKFTVADGAINVKDGPGDLQTTGMYKNFILQLECISHGKHLNSGVFFRCRDGEYQNGYEAQIRNQFTPEATQDYVVEEHDPMSHQLVAKHKIKGTAVDYGTGAIYRRQPARKEMSKDGEWFRMTISAQRNHFATWVNGVQVADWTDHRPSGDNARTGCYSNGGHLSIQGHDPTTNLSFRNLRIAETPWK